MHRPSSAKAVGATLKCQVINLEMKYYLLLMSLVASCGLLTAQETFDPNTGIFTYTYDPCKDPCSGATKADCDRYKNRDECRKLCDLQPYTDKEWLACIHKCNAPVSVIRRPVAWLARFVITTAPNDRSKWLIFDIPQQNNSNPSFSINTNKVWVDVTYYCYAYAILILYDDGTQCLISSAWTCNA